MKRKIFHSQFHTSCLLADIDSKRKKVPKDDFWKLNKRPEHLYGNILPRVINWLTSTFISDKKLVLNNQDLASLSLRINDVFKHRGFEGGIRYVKACRLVVMRFLSGTPFTNKGDSAKIGVSIGAHGLPTILSSKMIQSIVSGHTENIRLIMTILVASRALSLGTDADTSSITEPGVSGDNFEKLFSDMEKHTVKFWESCGYQRRSEKGMSLNFLPKGLRFKTYHFTTKSGPNGHALFTSLLDAINLPESLVEAICVVGGERITKFLGLIRTHQGAIREVLPELFESKRIQKRGPKLRVLASFPDKENKVRIIGIVDYFSQTVLKPLHSYLYKLLKTIPQDCTFNQGAFRDKLDFNSKEPFVSADLSAATDRFPIRIIQLVLEGRLPSWYCQAWKKIMVELPFYDPRTHAEIRYEVGNPMGAYSSWASFAVAHHFVIYYCCQLLNIPWRKAPYVLLGDDIVIHHGELAKKYSEVMDTLGVEVSVLKTHTSPHFFEFAKRLFYKGEEISPFPISALQQTGNKFWLITAVLYELERKGAWVAKNGIPKAVTGWFDIIFSYKAKSLIKLEDKVFGTANIIKVMKGHMSGGEFMNELAARWNLSFGGRSINDTVATNVLANIAVDLFKDSMPGSEKFKKASSVPLGELATSWTMRLTGLFDHPDPIVAEVCCDLIYAIPHLPCYGSVEETYMKLHRHAYEIDTIKGGDWPIILRTLALPLDDKIFVERTSRLITKGSMLVSKHLFERLEIIATYPGLLDF